MFVFVQDAAEPVASSHVEPGDPLKGVEWGGHRMEWAGVVDALMRPMFVV